MTLLEHIIKNNIVIDIASGYTFGTDQINEYYPTVFPTVTFSLFSTELLDEIADDIRVRTGRLPILENYGTEYDEYGYYEFTIGINGYNNSVDACIDFQLINSDQDDAEHTYMIDLNEESELIYKCLNEQTKEYFGKSCEELLEMARDELMK